MNREFGREQGLEEKEGARLREKPPQSFEDCTFFTIRHGDALYQKNEAIVASENPEGPFLPSEQDHASDLSPEGKERAQAKAKEFLSRFDAKRDALYFASSDLVRARETANIYLTTAKEMGFSIIESSPVDAKRPSESIKKALGGNEIRTLESLSLNIKNMLVEFVFSPHNYLEPKNGEGEHVLFPQNVSAPTKKLFKEARKIVEADDRGTWGKNFLAHSSAIGELFSKYAAAHPEEAVPTITTAEDMYATRFKTMLREMKLAKETAGAKTDDAKKRIRVVAFTHENPLLFFLEKEFNKHGIERLEAVGFEAIPDEAGVYHYFAALETKGHDAEVKEIEFPSRKTQ